MTLFQNISHRDIIVSRGPHETPVTISSGQRFRGKRFNESMVWSPLFRVFINTVDAVSGYSLIKETTSIVDNTWRTQLKETCPLFHSRHPIPHDTIVTILSRYRLDHIDYYLAYCERYHDYLWIPSIYCQPSFVPLSRPLLVRVIHPDGVLLHHSKEPLSRIVGFAPIGSILIIDKKDFSSFPSTCQLPQCKIRNLHAWFTYDYYRVDVIGNATPSLLQKYRHQSSYLYGDDGVNDPIPVSNKCCICFENDSDMTFIHGETSHTACCQNCSQRFDSMSSTHERRCPICRLPVEKIVAHFSS